MVSLMILAPLIHTIPVYNVAAMAMRESISSQRFPMGSVSHHVTARTPMVNMRKGMVSHAVHHHLRPMSLFAHHCQMPSHRTLREMKKSTMGIMP